MPAERTELRIRLLGDVRAERGGTGLPLGSARRRSVLAVLAGRANHALSREELVAAVWGDDEPASALGNLYTYVSTLRRVLEPERNRWSAARVLTSGGGGYCLHVDPDAVDALKFERLRERGRRLRAAGDTGGELAVLETALALWRGEALAGLPGPYAECERQRLGELYLASAERHAEIHLELGRPDAAAGELADLIARHPRREHLYGPMMAALARTGRTEAALALFHDLERRLRDEAGTEPAPELRDRYAELAAATQPANAAVNPPGRTAGQRPGTAGDEPLGTAAGGRSGVAGGALPGTAGAGFLVGRDRQLATIRTAVAAAAAGQGGTVWIDGEPGSGKSALIAAGLRDAERQGCRVGAGIGDEMAQRRPLSVLLECLDDSGATSTRETAELIRSLRAEPTGNPTLAVLDRIRSLVLAAGAVRPLVLVIDDLQWADEASLVAWHALHRLAGRTPLLLISAARPVPARRAVHLLRSVLPCGGTRMIDMPPLAGPDAAALVRAAGPAGLSAAAVTAAVEAGGGNPYYLRHLARSATGPALADPPAGVIAAVTAHLDLLTDQTRQLLRAIAFLGDDCVVTDLPPVTGRSVPDLLVAAEEAIAAGLLADTGHSLVFRHPVVRRVLHDALPTALRMTLHREFAEKIAAADGPPERVAAQLLAGPVPVDAWVGGWLAEHAALICARMPVAATAVLRHATAQPTLPPAVREPLTAHLARLLFRRGLPAEAEASWVAARTGDADLRAEMRWIIDVLRHRRGAQAAARSLATVSGTRLR